MPQVTIYLDAETALKAKAAARAAGLSQSRWIANLISRYAAGHWPDTVRQVTGSCPDFPDVATLRATLGEDSAREQFD